MSQSWLVSRCPVWCPGCFTTHCRISLEPFMHVAKGTWSMFNLCRCNRLLCSLVNALGHMGLVAHLRKETELCVHVVDLYLFVCVSFAWQISQPPGFARDMLRHPRCNSEGISGGHVESNSGRTKSPCGHRCTCTHMPMHLLFQID